MERTRLSGLHDEGTYPFLESTFLERFLFTEPIIVLLTFEHGKRRMLGHGRDDANFLDLISDKDVLPSLLISSTDKSYADKVGHDTHIRGHVVQHYFAPHRGQGIAQGGRELQVSLADDIVVYGMLAAFGEKLLGDGEFEREGMRLAGAEFA